MRNVVLHLRRFATAFRMFPVFIATVAATDVVAQTAQPAITSIRVDTTNIVVTARVPEGIHRVTLECRERLGGGAWEPRAISRIDGSGGLVTFRVARSRQVEMMRVRADTSDPLPAHFYTGTNEFYEMPAGSGGPWLHVPGVLDVVNPPPAEAPREVVESDIWRIRGQTLYFFNQLRGLQAIDLANPDAPRLRGTLELPAVGEDMYLLGEKHLVLLARNGCSSQESEVVIAIDNDNLGSPSITARLPVAGFIQESRLVGTALYVASSTYKPAANSGGSIWESGTLVSAFDLSYPDSPVARNSLWYPGSGNVVSATDRLLFVVTHDPTNWWQSIVRTIDITSADGTIRAHESIRTAGRVPDKFKLNWDGATLTAVSEDWRPVAGRVVTTVVETYRLPDPRSLGPVGVIKLGQLEVGAGEQLHATRFDGRRLYIVTFFRIDPLWVVDLSNPSSPRVAGSVDVPGWSTFIRPLGDRLVTIGVESNRVAVSLFDVSNPASPVLADRVRLGHNYSYSEANWDEQAFSVLPDAGLILVPFSGDTTNGEASSVQLIDLNPGSLAARGLIEHRFQPRRATLHGDRLLSISGWDLLTVDATDRDQPVVRNTLALAWPVDRVFLQGEFLVELGGAASWGWWGQPRNPELRVASAASPNSILSQMTLKELPVLGATVRSSRLYIAQGQQAWQGWPFDPIPLAEAGNEDSKPEGSKLLLTVFDLSALPAVQKLGETEAAVYGIGFGAQFQAIWPRADLLVFAGGGFNNGWWCLTCPVALAADAQLFWPWPPSDGGGLLVAFDVGNPAAPALASQVNLQTNGGWNFSAAHAANESVYLSHQTSYFLEAPAETDGAIAPEPSPEESKGSWVSRSYLDVVDFSDARVPVVRRPANIPGRLTGISRDGLIVYTVGTRWTTNITSWTEHLAAGVYDGVSVHLVDSLALPDVWPRPVLVSGTNLFIGWPEYDATQADGGIVVDPNDPATTASHSLQTWFLSKAGKLTRSGRVPLPQPADTLAEFQGLLAARRSDNTLALFNATDGARLLPAGGGRPAGCQWFDLTHADGALNGGLWLPLGAYGAARVPTPTSP